MTVDEMLAEQNEIMAAPAEDGDLSDAQVTRYEELDGLIQRGRSREELARRHAAARAAVTPVVTATPNRDDDTVARAFADYLRTGVPNADIAHLRARGDDVEQRAQNEGTASAGGFLVPDEFRNTLIKKLKAYGGIAGVAQELVTSTGAPLTWPTLDDTANVGEIVDEGGTFSTGADLVFGSAQLGAYKYAAGGASSLPIRLSWELIQDSAVDIVGLVTDALAERIGRIQATHLVSGTGIAQPQGIATGLTGIQFADQSDGIKYADLVTFVHSIDPAYRANARWAFNDNTLASLRKLVDTTGRPLLQPNASGTIGSPLAGETLLGYPVTIDQAFPNVSAASAVVNWGVFGDLRRGYVVRRVKDVTMVVNPYSRASNFQTEYSAYARMDAVQQDTNAYVALTGGAVA